MRHSVLKVTRSKSHLRMKLNHKEEVLIPYFAKSTTKVKAMNDWIKVKNCNCKVLLRIDTT